MTSIENIAQGIMGLVDTIYPHCTTGNQSKLDNIKERLEATQPSPALLTEILAEINAINELESAALDAMEGTLD